MYCVYDENNNIIAFHDKKQVVEKYVANVYKVHNVTLNIGKIKKSSKWKLEGKDELYLVRYNEGYVQSGYLLYLELSSTQYIEDEEYAIDIIYRILETNRLTDKQEKRLRKAVEVMEELLVEDRSYVPTLKQLESMKMDYDPYLYNTRLFYE